MCVGLTRRWMHEWKGYPTLSWNLGSLGKRSYIVFVKDEMRMTEYNFIDLVE